MVKVSLGDVHIAVLKPLNYLFFESHFFDFMLIAIAKLVMIQQKNSTKFNLLNRYWFCNHNQHDVKCDDAKRSTHFFLNNQDRKSTNTSKMKDVKKENNRISIEK